jgi:prevent-host-death family protein
MKKANISKIKAELSKYIKYAKAGEEVVIMDRDQPVAKIVGVRAEAAIQIREPSIDLKTLLAVTDKRTFDEKSDILDILLRDREDRH